MISKENIVEAARILREAEEQKIICDPVRNIIGSEDIAAAYKVQDINTQVKLKAGGRVIGQKIGLTAPTVQKQLGIDQPDFGLLWQDREVSNGGEISVSELMQPKAEAEIGFVLGRDLIQEQLSTVDIINAIDYAVVSIEIVGSRIRNWDIKITDTIADNASASHWVIGHQPTILNKVDVINCSMQIKNNNKIVSEGKGRNCLGSPINAMLWLAKKMQTMERPLQAGDLILSGALGPMVPIKAGDQIEARIEGLGSASVSFIS